jgi:hypothetical protein
MLYDDKGAFSNTEGSFSGPLKLVEDDARDDESNLFTLDHFLGDTEHCVFAADRQPPF